MARANFLVFIVGLSAIVSSCAVPPAGVTASNELHSASKAAAADYPVGIRTGIVRMSTDGSGKAPAWATPPERREVHKVVFADTAGRPLSFSPTGTDCIDACLKIWQPALVAARAQGVGDWTLVSVEKNRQQWAFRGKPLYYRVGDTPIDKPFEYQDFDPTDPWFTIGIPLQSSAADGMQLALVEPQEWIKMPFSMSAGEYRIAPGMVMIGGISGSNPMGTPLYAFSGTAEQEKELPAIFKPEYAAALDLPVGDFTIRQLPDGTHQWMFKGAPLYICTCDISTGDLNGKGAAAGIAPAMLVNYYFPSQVTIKTDLR